MVEALGKGGWDAVISDCAMPGFSATGALTAMHDMNLDLPFIVVSGTIDEESAVPALRAGAHDFVVKGKFARLGPAIERELPRGRRAPQSTAAPTPSSPPRG